MRKENRKSQVLHIREDEHIVELVDRLAAAQGSDRSILYREGIRLLLRKTGLLKDAVLVEGAA